MKSILVVCGGALLFTQLASAEMVMNAGGSCSTSQLSVEAPVYYFGGYAEVQPVPNAERAAYFTCSAPNTKGLTGGLPIAYVRFSQPRAGGNCSVYAYTSLGSTISGANVGSNTTGSQSLNLSNLVTSSASSGYFSVDCNLHEGSTLYSYRYEED